MALSDSKDEKPHPDLVTQVQTDVPVAPVTKEIASDPTATMSPLFMGGIPDFPYFTAPQSSEEIGRFGDYRVLSKLGEGGMGSVFRAEDQVLKRWVALKIMRPEIAVKPLAAERFLREARAAAGLKSDHIITIYAVGKINGVPYLASEFLEGTNLDEWMKRQNRAIPLAHTLRVVRDTLRGLAVAHAKDLIHRDIKPANLWLEKGTSRVKLLDFGLTRSADSDMRLTADGAVVGTPAYMSPEQASGKPVDLRSDLFSVGTVMYHMLAGKNPFSRGEILETLRAVCFEALPPITSIRNDVPREFSDFLDRLHQKAPDGRPSNASVALRELQKIERALQTSSLAASFTNVMPALPANPPTTDPDANTQGGWEDLHHARAMEPAGAARADRTSRTSYRSLGQSETPPPGNSNLTLMIIGILAMASAIILLVVFLMKML